MAGVGFPARSRRLLEASDVHVGRLRGAGVRSSLLVFGVLFVHSLPEGLAIGSAFASSTEGLALFIVLAIGLQNVPEGTSVAIPMQAAGFSRSQQFWAAVLTSAPQPVGAVVAYLAVEYVAGLLPFSFAFAAGAMLSLIVVELVPQAYAPGGRRAATSGTLAGGPSCCCLRRRSASTEPHVRAHGEVVVGDDALLRPRRAAGPAVASRRETRPHRSPSARSRPDRSSSPPR